MRKRSDDSFLHCIAQIPFDQSNVTLDGTLDATLDTTAGESSNGTKIDDSATDKDVEEEEDADADEKEEIVETKPQIEEEEEEKPDDIVENVKKKQIFVLIFVRLTLKIIFSCLSQVESVVAVPVAVAVEPDGVEGEENASTLNASVKETPKQDAKSEEKNTSRSGRVIKRTKYVKF